MNNNLKIAQMIKVFKNYDQKVAIKNCDLTLEKGEVFALLGPNGAGKTTLIKMLCGITPPTKGNVIVDGLDVEENPVEAKKLLGLAPEIPWVYEYLTGRQFLEFIGKIRDLGQDSLDKKIKELSDSLLLNEYLDQLGKGLSYGTKRRFMFAAALLVNPPLLVLDEIYNGLDPIQIKIVQSIIKNHAKNGGAVLLSTHILKHAEEVADRVGIIYNGELLIVGPTKELCVQMGVSNLDDLFFKVTGQEIEAVSTKSKISLNLSLSEMLNIT